MTDRPPSNYAKHGILMRCLRLYKHSLPKMKLKSIIIRHQVTEFIKNSQYIFNISPSLLNPPHFFHKNLKNLDKNYDMCGPIRLILNQLNYLYTYIFY